ncbi:YlzJ-like family protein [Rossellomorea marisflavi]|jgi:precorrin-4 methylase|uniref:YlzJ-like family protein n=1 Tax=Rossellomorea marisflavi TaxID=189381 RepID=UPI0028530557|nr:YlzJ-like family protein [Rossellomorea marisflavi]MDR4937112.1 YlzJ-like family protein [Rossellomorea marisflavi]
MILYTIIPQEAVFATDPEVYASQMMIDYEGVPLMVQKEEEKYRVLRVMSSDPSHFLDNRFSPGMILGN